MMLWSQSPKTLGQYLDHGSDLVKVIWRLKIVVVHVIAFFSSCHQCFSENDKVMDNLISVLSQLLVQDLRQRWTTLGTPTPGSYSDVFLPDLFANQQGEIALSISYYLLNQTPYIYIYIYIGRFIKKSIWIRLVQVKSVVRVTWSFGPFTKAFLVF